MKKRSGLKEMTSIECGTYRPVKGFSCTNSDESHIWKELHGSLLDKFHCGTCQIHAHGIFLGVHSLVSLGIGKKLVKEEYKTNFLKLRDEINLVYNEAIKDGRL